MTEEDRIRKMIYTDRNCAADAELKLAFWALIDARTKGSVSSWLRRDVERLIKQGASAGQEEALDMILHTVVGKVFLP